MAGMDRHVHVSRHALLPGRTEEQGLQDCPLVAMCILKTAQAGAVRDRRIADAACDPDHVIWFVTTCSPTGWTVHLPTILLEPWPDRRLGAGCVRAP